LIFYRICQESSLEILELIGGIQTQGCLRNRVELAPIQIPNGSEDFCRRALSLVAVAWAAFRFILIWSLRTRLAR